MFGSRGQFSRHCQTARLNWLSKLLSCDFLNFPTRRVVLCGENHKFIIEFIWKKIAVVKSTNELIKTSQSRLFKKVTNKSVYSRNCHI